MVWDLNGSLVNGVSSTTKPPGSKPPIELEDGNSFWLASRVQNLRHAARMEYLEKGYPQGRLAGHDIEMDMENCHGQFQREMMPVSHLRTLQVSILRISEIFSLV